MIQWGLSLVGDRVNINSATNTAIYRRLDEIRRESTRLGLDRWNEYLSLYNNQMITRQERERHRDNPVMDLDDDIWSIDADTPEEETYLQGKHNKIIKRSWKNEKKIKNFVFTTASTGKMIDRWKRNTSDSMIQRAIQNGYQITSDPWYITPCQSKCDYPDFCNKAMSLTGCGKQSCSKHTSDVVYCKYPTQAQIDELSHSHQEGGSSNL